MIGIEAILFVAALEASPEPAPSPSATPVTGVPSPAAAPQPPPASSASPDVLTTSVASPVPTTTPPPFLYRFVPRQPDEVAPHTPQIFAVYLNDKKLHSQGPIDIKVSTSPEVVKVVSRSGGQAGVIPRIAAGDFETYSTLPKVPFIAKGMTVYLEFVATGPTGVQTTVRVPVQIQ